MGKRIESLADLTPDTRNARKRGQRAERVLVASLQEVGAARSIVVDENGRVLAGNGTVEAAAELGMDRVKVVDADGETIIAVRRTGLTEEQKRRLAVLDNRTGELAEWNTDVLAGLIVDGLDVTDLWSPDELDALFANGGAEDPSGLLDNVDPDDIPEDAPTRCNAGDLWQLGEHHLLCGDSTKAEDVARLMGGAKADMLLSDPPYGVSYVGKTSEALTIESDSLDEDGLADLVVAAFDNAEASCRPGAYWYATVPARPLHLIFAGDWKRRGILRQIMVWAKDSMVLGHSEYHYKHEPILFGWVPGGERHKNSDRTRTTVWEYDRPKRSAEHPTMKPVALWSQAIQDGSRKGDAVYDPFLGSGTTLIAAEQLGRKCYGMEIDPKYCDVILARWEAATGKVAVRL